MSPKQSKASRSKAMKAVWAKKREEKAKQLANAIPAPAVNHIGQGVEVSGPPAYRFIPRRAVKAVVKTTYSDGTTSKEVNTFNPNNGY